ncbi:hypothetical protein L1987_39564 [Smallanthus sonchifolius]|uniref:Uncharacterized protein n=1 Tax=Smallanthus sonchifolius TaxID=185202 RepID=A0ACB9HNH9_9ASTR|nr:hypothetical protein L1987_39564 [Smallanthus sonchifolius]
MLATNCYYPNGTVSSPGCQDVNECEDRKTYPCYGKCDNTPGSYNCSCLRGFVGDATNENGCQHIVDSKISPTIYVIIAMVIVLLAIISGILVRPG